MRRRAVLAALFTLPLGACTYVMDLTVTGDPAKPTFKFLKSGFDHKPLPYINYLDIREAHRGELMWAIASKQGVHINAVSIRYGDVPENAEEYRRPLAIKQNIVYEASSLGGFGYIGGTNFLIRDGRILLI